MRAVRVAFRASTGHFLPMFALALTGGIASGKSLFGRFLAGCGAQVADADDIVRAMHAPGAGAVASLFGRKYLASDGSTDRVRLGALVFADVGARRLLEEKLHPLVRSELLAWKNAPAPAGAERMVRVAQIPLLFESGWNGDWDGVATVETSDLETRVGRLAGRGLDREAALARISSQLSAAVRMERADFAVRNDGTPDALERIAKTLYAHLTNP